MPDTMTTGYGLQRITQNYVEDVAKFPHNTRADWLKAIQEDFAVAAGDLDGVGAAHRDAWLVHVAAMIARYVELPKEQQT